jgi:hypothetical protein
MINQVDKDGNGQIDFVEFLEVIAQETMEAHSTEEIMSVFREIDKKGLGFEADFESPGRTAHHSGSGGNHIRD